MSKENSSLHITEKEIEILEHKIEDEVPTYDLMSNTIVGLGLITLFGTSLTTDNPIITAYLLLPVAFGLFQVMFQHYPPTLRKLGQLIEREKNKKIKAELKSLDTRMKKNFFSYKKLFSTNLLYISSFLLYTSLLFPNVATCIKSGEYFSFILTSFKI